MEPDGFGEVHVGVSISGGPSGSKSLVIHSQVWHPRIPLKISFFMLRLLVEKLPLIDALWRVGVQLASKCLCCQEGANELLEYVFSEGHVEVEVWN